LNGLNISKIGSPGRIFRYILMLLFFLSPVDVLYSEAYLSEDRIYYGGDTYTIDYSREIIFASGNAFFRRGEKTVRAQKIVIYYSRDQKRAELSQKVKVVDSVENTTITGTYGQALYLDGIYRIWENAVFKDPIREITCYLIETRKDDYTRFEKNVQYKDEEYIITAPLLNISKKNAVFSSGVFAVKKDTGDRLYCDSLTYLLDSGKATFQGDVLLIQGGNKDESEKPLISAGIIKYFPEQESYFLFEQVFIRTSDTAIKAPCVAYYIEDGYMHAYGGVSIHQEGRDIYSGDVKYYYASKKVILYNLVKGVFKSGNK